jgi:hypothetical protein
VTTSTATLQYTAYLGGASAARAAALLSSVPPPAGALAFLGVRVISDSTPVATPAVRTILLGLNPTSDATATCGLVAGDVSGSPIDDITVTGAGSGYVLPPIVTFTGGRASGVDQANEPIDQPNQQAASLDRPAVAQAYLSVVGVSIDAAGAGYSAATTATVVGQVKPGNGGLRVGGGSATAGRPAVLALTIVAGNITGVSITDPGDGYVGVPTVVIFDPAVTPGSGGAISVQMGVGRIDLLNPGAGYVSAPTVVLTPYFQAAFPLGSDQAAPFKQLMTTQLEQVLMSPVSAALPVIT